MGAFYLVSETGSLINLQLTKCARKPQGTASFHFLVLGLQTYNPCLTFSCVSKNTCEPLLRFRLDREESVKRLVYVCLISGNFHR